MEIKICKYVGLAKKANGIVYGLDNIKQAKEKIFLLLVCETASTNLYEEICYISISKKIPLHKFDYITLDQILNTDNCKVIGITNKDLASQIKFILDKEN